MGRKDKASKILLRRNENFASVFNTFVFGAELIKPEELQDLPAVTVLGKDVTGQYLSRTRDLLKQAVIKTDGKRYYVLLGIENQSEPDDSMPVRTALYKLLKYQEQVDAHKEMRRKSREKIQSYPSDLTKGVKLIPVITLVVNLSDRPWDGPRDLYGLMDQSLLSILGRFINNYRMNILDPYEMTDEQIELLYFDIRNVLLFIRAQNSKEEIWELKDKYGEEILNETVIDAINELTNAGLSRRKGGIKMCRGIEELKDEVREQTRIEKDKEFARKRAEIIAEKNKEIEQIREQAERICRRIDQVRKKEKYAMIQRIMDRNNCSFAEACSCLYLTEDEIRNLKELTSESN